jgi:disulfide bond formation protein DsbB
MIDAEDSSSIQRLLSLLNYVYFLLMMTVIAGIITAAMVLQYAKGELPCPLCLLQRIAMFGVCFGIMQNFRRGFSYQNTGFSLLFTIFLLIVSVRQTLLDIYPRPGHAYIGSAVLGIHMPVWSIIIALCLLSAYAAKLHHALLRRRCSRHGQRCHETDPPCRPRNRRCARSFGRASCSDSVGDFLSGTESQVYVSSLKIPESS